MAQLKKFKGCPYPITPHPLGYLRTQWGVNQIKSDMLQLLLTNPGERVMLPTFGTPLRKLFFEPNDVILRNQAREMIINSLQTWEPRIAVTAVEVTSGVGGLDSDIFEKTEPPRDKGLFAGDDLSDVLENNDHVLGIKITFVDPENINEIQELILEVPLQ